MFHTHLHVDLKRPPLSPLSTPVQHPVGQHSVSHPVYALTSTGLPFSRCQLQCVTGYQLVTFTPAVKKSADGVFTSLLSVTACSLRRVSREAFKFLKSDTSISGGVYFSLFDLLEINRVDSEENRRHRIITCTETYTYIHMMYTSLKFLTSVSWK